MKPSIKIKTVVLRISIIFTLGSLALSQGARAVGPDTGGAIPGANLAKVSAC